ncbi:hypothetical protein ACIPZ8_12630 [Pseudomonas sp. NPDC089422]|uniref:hypothetical protein n=1 Tax=Pseudomonas sp. NPDC089422 TaxID=3364466 RepID=UPI00380FEAD6
MQNQEDRINKLLESIRHLIGSRYVKSVEPYILELTGKQFATVHRGDIVTLDYAEGRIRLFLDENDLIKQFVPN